MINWALSYIVGQSKIGSACLEIRFTVFQESFQSLYFYFYLQNVFLRKKAEIFIKVYVQRHLSLYGLQ